MPTRREFLKRVSGTTAGIFFVGCGCVDSSLGFAANAQQAGAQVGRKRPEVNIGGRRVRVIDVHSHVRVPEVWDLVKDRMGREGRTDELQQANPDSLGNIHNVDKRLADLDEMGIDVQAVSINPFWYWAEVDLARKIIQIQNKKIAELCSAHPDRFVGLGSVALQHPSLAVEQMEEGVKKLGMRGFAIGGSVNGEDLSAAKFNPIWAKAEELQALIFIHPQGSAKPADERRMRGNGLLENVIGHPLETTLALTHLIQDGTLDLFPRLKICAAHGGGYLPSYSGRNDRCLTAFPKDCRPLKKLPSEYLKQLYFDSVLFTPEDMRHLVAVVGSSQVVVGTDYPALWNRSPVDGILTIPQLNDAERVSIFSGTLSKLLKIDIA
jgi:aminocarboxymuconate-semialdehyde decarboxylase